jgi:lipid-A-disaccharide synthase
VKVRYASILNLIADRAVIPELIQQDCTPGKLAATLAPLLTDPAAADAQRAALRPLLAALRPPTGLPSEAAAAAVLSLLDGAGPDQAGSNQARSNQAGSDEARGGQAGAG